MPYSILYMICSPWCTAVYPMCSGQHCMYSRIIFAAPCMLFIISFSCPCQYWIHFIHSPLLVFTSSAFLCINQWCQFAIFSFFVLFNPAGALVYMFFFRGVVDDGIVTSGGPSCSLLACIRIGGGGPLCHHNGQSQWVVCLWLLLSHLHLSSVELPLSYSTLLFFCMPAIRPTPAP